MISFLLGFNFCSNVSPAKLQKMSRDKSSLKIAGLMNITPYYYTIFYDESAAVNIAMEVTTLRRGVGHDPARLTPSGVGRYKAMNTLGSHIQLPPQNSASS